MVMPCNKTDSDYMVWYSIQLLQRTIESKHKAIFHHKNMPQFYGKDVNFLRLMMKKKGKPKEAMWLAFTSISWWRFYKAFFWGLLFGILLLWWLVWAVFGWLVGWLLDCLVGFSCVVSSCISTCHFWKNAAQGFQNPMFLCNSWAWKDFWRS